MKYLLTILTAFIVVMGSVIVDKNVLTQQEVIDLLKHQFEDYEYQTLGSDFKLIAGFPYYLAGTGISSTATSFTLTSFTIPQTGQKIQDGDLEDTFYLTLEPGNRDRQELVGCTTVVQNSDGTASISGCSRGLSPIQPYTASSSLQFAHSGSAVVVLSNPPQVYDALYDYVNNLALGDAVEASEAVAGFVELATQAEMAAGTTTGGTGASLVLKSGYATSSCDVVGNYIPITAVGTGRLSEDCIPSSFASTTSFTIGDTPIMNIGQNAWASTTNGTSTWSVPSGIKKIKVTLVGPGGDGAAGGSGTSGSGGGAGAACVYWYNVSATSTLQYHIGDGGTQEYSWFGGTYASPVMKATGGADGTTSGPGGIGGTATGCTLNHGGGDGGGVGGSTDDGAGDGGDSIFGGGGGRGENTGGASSGTAGKACGAGGGGGSDSQTGGAGYDGCLIIEY